MEHFENGMIRSKQKIYESEERSENTVSKPQMRKMPEDDCAGERNGRNAGD